MLGSASITLINGGWETEYFDLSLFDLGMAEIAAGYQDGNLGVSAMASIWAPSITIVIWDVDVTIAAHIGSIGGCFNVGSDGLNLGGANVWGGSISFDW